MNQIDEKNAKLKEEYLQICKVIPEFDQQYSLKQYSFVRMIVQTNLVNIGCSPRSGLVPLFDVFKMKVGNSKVSIRYIRKID